MKFTTLTILATLIASALGVAIPAPVGKRAKIPGTSGRGKYNKVSEMADTDGRGAHNERAQFPGTSGRGGYKRVAGEAGIRRGLGIRGMVLGWVDD
ncbi:uncharacterized protein RAG0_18049 [Rhynchosporium agropyri]|uniref:GEgh 16 protein n=1 Tax=Rhynchosporium agropyri TaxID=914238 RepID=A0A1E1KNL8_9HELO|nr:uncharacterized protein RAG0_18049 [Rhynchosporium agropyri]